MGEEEQGSGTQFSASAGNAVSGLCSDDVAGMVGLEPTNAGVKVPCLTAWLHPNVEKSVGPERTLRPSRLEVIWGG